MPALGRIPSPPDARDWQLEKLQLAAADPLDAALTAVLASTSVALATKNWIKVATPRLKTVSPYTPPQPSPTPVVVWPDNEAVLDQGSYGTCVGNGLAQFLNTNPVDDKFIEGGFGDGTATQGGTTARALYYETTVLDGAPDNPDGPQGGQQGATVRSGAKVLVNRKRIAAYAFASTLVAVSAHIATSGPMIIGSDWTNDMFNPDAAGLVHPTGGVAGGHCYLLIGDHPDVQELEFLNSWGPGWGVNGRFRMTYADFTALVLSPNSNGEAVAAVELPL